MATAMLGDFYDMELNELQEIVAALVEGIGKHEIKIQSLEKKTADAGSKERLDYLTEALHTVEDHLLSADQVLEYVVWGVKPTCIN